MSPGVCLLFSNFLVWFSSVFLWGLAGECSLGVFFLLVVVLSENH